MKFLIVCSMILADLPAIAQTKDSVFRPCDYSFKVRYPRQAQLNNISGEVIVEIERDENCKLSNPRVIKGLGYGCDEEAIRAVKEKIIGRNKCIVIQNDRACEKGKVTQTIIFSDGQDDK